jgi:hypothetical protein
VPPRPAKHTATRFDTYVDAHEGNMEKLRGSEFVAADTLFFEELPGTAGIFLSGEVACEGGIVVSVEKFLDVLEGDGPAALVQTEWYSYNVFVRGWHNVLRYDNQHPQHLYPGHQDPHHKHVFDWRSGEEREDSPTWIGAEEWPTLSEVIREAEGWYWGNRGDLPDPDAYPGLAQRD